MKLEELQPGASVTGVEPTQIVTVVATVPIGEGLGPAHLPHARRHDEGATALGAPTSRRSASPRLERPWSFDGDGAAFQLTCEAKRIDLAFLFDPMMAVHTSNVEPLPHQITAVYESMLPRQPLRFVLADDPGAGKTIMAGLYIRELDHAGRRPPHPDRRPGQPGRAVAGRAVREVRPGVPHLLAAARAGLAERQPVRGPPPAHRPARPAVPERGAAGEALRRRLGPGRLRRGPQARRPLTSARSSRRPAASASPRSSARTPATCC